MNWLSSLSQSLGALLLCLVAGAVASVYLPAAGAAAHVVGQLYLALINMASLPLLVVATFFGLRQTLALPHPGRRMLMIVGLALVMVVGCALAGLVSGSIFAPGAHLDIAMRDHLGSLVQQQGGAGGDTEMRLWTHEVMQLPEHRPWANALPDNFFRALSEGRSLGILSCAILFGLGFAWIARSPSNALNQLFEGSYRALELIIQKVTILLPIVVFGMTAHLMHQVDRQTVLAMSSFMVHLFGMVLLLGLAALAVVAHRSGHGFISVLQHLKAPMLVSLMSQSTTAAIPHTIEAMSSRLGFSRGIVELLVPTSAVFLRAGSALYYVLLTLFVANLYDRSLAPMEWGLVCLASTLAAFSSAGSSSLTNVVFSSMVLNALQLPGEAAVALFLSIDLLCEGPRNLLTLLACCMLIALVSAGLPSERTQAAEHPNALLLNDNAAPLQLVFDRLQLVVLGAASLLAAALIFCMGVLVGLQAPAAPPALPSASQTDHDPE